MAFDDRYGDRWRDRGGRPSGPRGDWGRGDYGRSDYRSDYERGAYRGDRGRPGFGRDDDRGFFDRAGDEVRSWFGDEDAQLRREEDYRRWEREQRMTGERSNQDGYGAYGETAGGGWGNQRGESWHRDRPGRPGWLGDSGRDEFYSREGHGGPGGRNRSDFRSGGADSGDLYGYGRAPGGTSGFGGAPVGGVYSTSFGREPGGHGSQRFGPASEDRSGRTIYDPHYSQWRQRQIDALDRDYDEYRTENQSRFESEFGTWRTRRQGQRDSLNRVTQHMEVTGSDGSHVGTVDKVRGDRIILTRSDPSAGGIHHSIPCGWVESVDTKVTLNKSASEAMDAWRSEDRSRALFEREDSGSEGPRVLNRSFSGTYDRDEEGRDEDRGGES